MTTAGSDPDREEIIVRLPDAMVDRVDESCRTDGYPTRSEFVSEAIERAVERRE